MSLHADAVAALAAWTAPSGDQEQLRRRYLDHLRARPDGVERACRPDHLTASTVVLGPDLATVLLTLHAKAGRWFQLGGHCEPQDRTLAGAALREATEESGLTGLLLDPVPVHLDEHAVAFCGPSGAPEVHHLDVRFLAVATTTAEVGTSESLELRWWPVDSLPHPDPGLVKAVGLARTRARAQSTSSGGGSRRAAVDQPNR